MFECLSRWCDIPKRNPAEGVFGVGGGRCDSATEDCGADWRCTFCWVGERTEEGRRRGRRRFTGRGFVSSLWGVVLNWINLLWNARAPHKLMFLYLLQIEWVRKGKASRVRRGVFWKAMSWNEIWKGAISHRVWALHSLLPRHPYVALSEPVSPPAHPTTLPASLWKKKKKRRRITEACRPWNVWNRKCHKVTVKKKKMFNLVVKPFGCA